MATLDRIHSLSETDPPDWEVLKIDESFDFLQNNTCSRSYLNPSIGLVNNIHYGDVLIKYGSLLDCDIEAIPFINPEIEIKTENQLVQDGDVIITDTAEDTTVGKATEVFNVRDRKIVSGLHTILIRPKPNLFSKLFLGFFLNSHTFHDQLLPFIVGTKVSSISRATLRETLVYRPPIKEQEKIVATLLDMDIYITALDKLIEKKQNIKKGVMRSLLTGKHRLPGFQGEWVERSLGELIPNLQMGQSPNSRFYNSETIGLPLIQGNADIEDRKTKIRNYTSQITKTARVGDYVMTVRAPVGNIAKVTFDCCLGRGVCGFSYPNDYLYHWFVFNESSWKSLSTGSTFDSISGDQLRKVVIRLPQEELEQYSIATILSDLDSEIAILSIKINKLTQLKQGMMRELLTGRIRLMSDIENDCATISESNLYLQGGK